MLDKELLNKEYYSTLDLKGGNIFIQNRFGAFPFLEIQNKRIILEVMREETHLFKRNIFSLKIRDGDKKEYHPFAGHYFCTEYVVINITKKDLLKVIQEYIDLYYKKWIKLAAFT